MSGVERTRVDTERTLLDVFRKLAERGEDYRMSRIGDVLMAANQAGVAFGNAGVGAVHALAYPLGGVHHVAHGEPRPPRVRLVGAGGRAHCRRRSGA